jgi:hypothetical protein
MTKVLTRLLISIPGALFVSFVFNYFNHKAYYTTIRNTQTVDLSILVNTLPTKLSQLLKNNNLEEIQKTISSNYGLFGIIVTNCEEEKRECSNQKVIIKSQPERKGWGEKQFPEKLSGNLYDVLRDPAPITAEWKFKDPRSVEFISTGEINKGRVIGRVYYIRRDPPDFFQSQKNWLLIPIESLQILTTPGNSEKAGNKLYEFIDSGANKYYSLTNLLGFLVGLFIWRIWERILYNKLIQQKLYAQKEKGLALRIDRFQKSYLESQEEVQRLENSLTNKQKDENILRNELNKARTTLKDKKQETQGLKDKLEESIKDSELEKNKSYELIQQLNSARESVNEKWKLVSSLQHQLKVIEQTNVNILDLENQINQAIQEAAISQSNAEEFSRKLEESSENIRNKEANYLALSKKFLKAQEILETRESDISRLQSSIADISLREDRYLRAIASLNQEKMRLEVEKKQLENSRQQDRNKELNFIVDEQINILRNSLEEEIKDLKRENDDFSRKNIKLGEEKELLQNKLHRIIESKTDFENYLCEDENIDFSSISDALKAAQESCSSLEIWGSAFDSAKGLNICSPNTVYRNLLILNHVGELYFCSNSLGTTFDMFLQSKGVSCSGESTTTLNCYGEDRIFRHHGISKQMSRHLRVGRRLRIHFDFDEKQKKVQIGYCGNHLRTANG